MQKVTEARCSVVVAFPLHSGYTNVILPAGSPQENSKLWTLVCIDYLEVPSTVMHIAIQYTYIYIHTRVCIYSYIHMYGICA